MLFLRMSSILADRGWSVNLVDYRDGMMTKDLRDPRVKIIPYVDEGPVAIPRDSTLVLQTMTPWSIFPGLRVEGATKVLFWTCHPFNLVPTVPLLRHIIEHGAGIGSLAVRALLPTHWARVKRFLRMLIDGHSIIFMDVGTARNTSAYLRENIGEPTLVPLPVPAGRLPRCPAWRETNDAIRIGWVGRISDFKYPILSYTMKRLDEVASGMTRPVSMDIVGGGDYLAPLMKDAAELKRLHVRFLGEKSPGEVARFMESGLDLLLAMGTSAAEGAACGVPTILLDFTYGRVPASYSFRWLQDRVGYSLGELIGSAHVGPGDDGLERKVHEAVKERERLGAEGREYVKRNHSIEVVAARFEGALVEAKVVWGDLFTMGVLKRGVTYRMYRYLKALHSRP